MDWPGQTTIVSDVHAEAAVLEHSAMPSPAAHAAMMSLRMLPPCSRGTPREQESGSPKPGIPSYDVPTITTQGGSLNPQQDETGHTTRDLEPPTETEPAQPAWKAVTDTSPCRNYPGRRGCR